MDSRTRDKEIESLKIKLATILFKEAGGKIETLNGEVVPTRTGILDRFFVGNKSFKVRDISSEENLIGNISRKQ